jgi:hypothetical protein
VAAAVEEQARVIHTQKRWQHRGRVKPTHRRFHRCVEVCVDFYGGMLGRDLTVIGGSVRLTGNLPDWADVVAHEGAVAVRGQRGSTFQRRVWVRQSIFRGALDRSRLFWPRSIDWNYRGCDHSFLEAHKGTNRFLGELAARRRADGNSKSIGWNDFGTIGSRNFGGA